MNQKVTIWLKDNLQHKTMLQSVQEFIHVTNFIVSEGVYRVEQKDATSTFPIHNVLATRATMEEDGS